MKTRAERAAPTKRIALGKLSWGKGRTLFCAVHNNFDCSTSTGPHRPVRLLLAKESHGRREPLRGARPGHQRELVRDNGPGRGQRQGHDLRNYHERRVESRNEALAIRCYDAVTDMISVDPQHPQRSEIEDFERGFARPECSLAIEANPTEPEAYILRGFVCLAQANAVSSGTTKTVGFPGGHSLSASTSGS